MKRALIIGAAGFVGGYLAEHLQKACGWDVYVTKLPQEVFEMEGIKCHDLDILDATAADRMFQEVSPDFIFHLAAQSSVALSWKQPGLTADVNIKGCVNVLEAVRKMAERPRVLLVGSSEEYGAVAEAENPVSEKKAPKPGNIYAATKACQNMLGKIYADAYQMDVMMVRAFNHIGPGQMPMFVVSDFCKQVAEIEKGIRESVIYVGNLSARRDFTDVRDIVRAYAMLAQKGSAGKTYNVGSGEAVSIQYVLEKILLLSQVKIQIKVEPQKLRPVDVPIIEADIRKLKAATGWQRNISLERTLMDTLEYWRKYVK